MRTTSAAASVRALPQELEPELQLPGTVGARDGAERAGAADAAGRAEVRPVEQVERLEPEFELRWPAERKGLGQCRVELPEDRTAHGVALGVAERLARIGRHADAIPVEVVDNRLRAALR